MGIKTEDMVRGLPPKEVTEGVDWLGILDSFNPKELSARYLNECARRNPFETCYRWDTPYSPVDERLRHPDCSAEYAEEDPHSEIVLDGDAPCVYASVDVILKWINEGKPRITDWIQAACR